MSGMLPAEVHRDHSFTDLRTAYDVMVTAGSFRRDQFVRQDAG